LPCERPLFKSLNALIEKGRAQTGGKYPTSRFFEYMQRDPVGMGQ
jgi:hypothetical protein